MAKNRRPAEELSIEELEALLTRKKLEARSARLRKFQRSGRALRVRREPEPEVESEAPSDGEATEESPERPVASLPEGANRLLLGVEVGAVLALLFILVSGFDALRSLNQEVAEARLAPSPTPLITAVVLPSGHTPPTSPGGAAPNVSEIPEHLRPLVQSMPASEIPTPSPAQVQRLHLPAIWESPAPVVQGDGWEQLKKGVGYHLGSGFPGQPGNVVLSAHNDIFGELFRDLDQLQPGDEVIISTGFQEFLYRVTGMTIVEPTEVSVMAPTVRPTVTLISCYPYLVDTQRIVVTAELVES